jgi:hypothetical protein
MRGKKQPDNKAHRLRKQAARLDDESEAAARASEIHKKLCMGIREDEKANRIYFKHKREELQKNCLDFKLEAKEKKLAASELRQIADIIDANQRSD